MSHLCKENGTKGARLHLRVFRQIQKEVRLVRHPKTSEYRMCGHRVPECRPIAFRLHRHRSHHLFCLYGNRCQTDPSRSGPRSG